jgi:hypothetical protein
MHQPRGGQPCPDLVQIQYRPPAADPRRATALTADSGDPRRDEAEQRTSPVRKNTRWRRDHFLDDLPLQWLVRIRAYPIVVPREALLAALTSDVAVKCGVDQPKAYDHRPSTDWHACG